MRAAGWLTLLVLASVLAAPPAAADAGFEVIVRDFDGPVTPLYEQGETTVTALVPCTDVLLARAPRVVNLTAIAPPWADAKLHPESLELPVACVPGERVALESRLVLNTTADAPAFSPEDVEVEATLDVATDTLHATATAPVEAGYVTLVAAAARQPVSVARAGADGGFKLSVVSLGNGDTTLTFRVDTLTHGWRVTLPDTTVVGPHAGTIRSGSHAFDVGFRPPDDLPRGRHFANLTLVIAAESVREDAGGHKDAARVDVVLTALVPEAMDAARSIPAPAPVLAVLLAGVLVKLYPESGRRRTRDDE